MLIRHFGENLSVDFDLLVGHFRDEGAVLFAVHAKSGVEARDPQAAEGSLLHPTVAIGILAGLEQGFFCGAIGGFAVPHIPFGGFQNFFSSFGGGHAAFDS